ncbi:MAG: GNAT family N-acetyltransferase [Rhizobiaceae bacterium]
MKIRVASSINEADPEVWDRLAGQDRATAKGNPFVSHAFLSSLEDSGSATARTGWLAQHLLLEDAGGALVGALPAYLKNHSQGEYVFDHGWADALERAGGRYYPKLQCSVPFTPATGPRLLTLPDADQARYQAALLTGAKMLAERHEASSVHITFMEQREWETAAEAGFLQRTDQQFHWQNQGYASFEEFLQGLSSRKRKNIRKERETALGESGIEVDWITGSDLNEAVWDRFFEFYMDTGSRKWGRPYLTREFYSLIGERMAQRIVLIMARRNGEHVAGAINFISGDTLYGRHWGCKEDHPFLHFEICYYQAIEYAISHGLSRVEAGAQGAHKLARGYVPVLTRSAHWIAHPGLRRAVEAYLNEERDHVAMEQAALKAHAPFRKNE